MNKLIIGFLLIAFTSCSSDKLSKLSINCICRVSEHSVSSTDEKDDNIKEFSFTNSPLFNHGIDKQGFALSSAILINNEYEIDSTSVIKISLINDKEGKKKTFEYSFTSKEIEEKSTKYFQIEALINEFVSNMYAKNYSVCKTLTNFETKDEEFHELMSKVSEGLDEGYIDTRILNYSVGRLGYEIHGGIWTKSKKLNLFRMQFEAINDDVKISFFNF
ncbi:hypothetical protein [Labilibacter marinus]|uniref:hypothetical protein n=1 Tax=Labilibacter marinus TaxID=1477105 RepID=UPI00082AFAC3|nr:hypothetical protein [Labilibacter marinus]